VALRIGQPVSDHSVQAYVRGEPAPIVFELSRHRGSWVVLFFYPGDFTLICPTELAAFAKRHDDFIREGAVLLAASTNSCFSHKAWFETDPRLAEVRYPVIADSLRELSHSFGVLLEDGAAHRGTFIIDPDGVLVHMSITANDVGRSVDEVLRVLRAFRTGALCPADWAPGDPTLTSKDDWLAKVFPDLIGPELDSLEESAQRVSFAPGETIVAEGDPRTASSSSPRVKSRSAAVAPRATRSGSRRSGGGSSSARSGSSPRREGQRPYARSTTSSCSP
jgi:peroxiredoxin 2/4